MKLKIGRDKTKKQPLPMIGGDGKSSKNTVKTESPATNSTDQNKIKQNISRFNKKYLIIVAAVVLIAVGGVGAYYFYDSKKESNEDLTYVPVSEELINLTGEGNTKDVERPETPEEINARISQLEQKKAKSGLSEDEQNELGVLYLQRGDKQQAVETLESQLGSNEQENLDTLSALALGYYDNGQNDKAIETYERMIKIVESKPERTALDEQRINQYKVQIDWIKQGIPL